MTPRTEPRPCRHCGQSFTWNSRYPTRRFCDPRCKAAHARDHKNARRRELRRLRKDARQQAITAARPADRHGNQENHGNHGNREDRVRLMQANAMQLCPHCRQPVAVVSLLLNPEAAHVDAPSRSVT
jgi:endogenous inhibitor of DNA gyrase (YacG/DUF329 family)